MKYITVFGSALPKAGDEEYLTAYKLGKLLGEAGLGVCSGGYQGIMEAVSKGCTDTGGKAIGVTVNIFGRKPNPYLTEVIETPSLFQRIQKLIEIGSGFIVLRGGTGTMLELAVVWEFFNKEFLNSKPVAAHGKMWKPIIEQIDERMKFEKRNVGIVKHFDEVEEAFKYVSERI
jgi:uncharacterized protein (TIGR00730 family)